MMEISSSGKREQTIYDFLWGEYCDWYIEMAKIRLRSREASLPATGAGACSGNIAAFTASFYAFCHRRTVAKPEK